MHDLPSLCLFKDNSKKKLIFRWTVTAPSIYYLVFVNNNVIVQPPTIIYICGRLFPCFIYSMHLIIVILCLLPYK